ncbi:CaiB/BaiF CoA transferase family protein [Rhodococcus sp. NPDC057529]|uniref:CaiB/BaiF CoA transferase family protein n=1 Tax=Rhodococcus sp. NPDC057529 TaxID=3346158 RepID=UPI0036702108
MKFRALQSAGPADGALAGITVVDFGQYIAAPAAAATFAELGADVIKIEPLNGDQARRIGVFGDAMIRACNRGKRSLAVDLRDPRGKDIARRLVAGADVVVQNMRPGAMERLGLGVEDVHALNPRAVYASVTGFGSHGPSRARAGLDIAAQAESGIMSVTGTADGDPLRVGLPLVDAATADSLSQAILAALFRRERTGRGAEIEISLLEVAIHLQAANWEEYFDTGREPIRRGNGQPTVAPAADVIGTRDGHIVLSAYTVEHWASLCRLIGREDLVHDPRFGSNPARVDHRAELLAILGDVFGRLTTQECVTWLSGNGIVAGAVRGYREVLESEDVGASGIFRLDPRKVEGGRYVGLPYQIAGEPRSVSGPAPDLGEHTVSVLSDSGLTATEIDGLLAAGVVAQPIPIPIHDDITA